MRTLETSEIKSVSGGVIEPKWNDAGQYDSGGSNSSTGFFAEYANTRGDVLWAEAIARLLGW